MRQQLAHLQALNQADSLLTDDSLAQALALYFDDHGTPNEQMEAHYLLGRTHADRGEAPAAIAAYHDAIDRADTTAADCNYSQLWRVYSQIANVFYQQNLMDDFLYSLNKSIFFAKMCNDTLTVLGLQAHKMTAYERLNMPDSVLSIYKYVNKGLCDKGFSQYAAAYSVFAINSFLQKGQLEEARNCIRFYEEETGFFDETGNIEKGREVFFNYRGRYHLAKQQYDSAYHYFRKELEEGRDHNNQNAASKGLAQIFLQTGHPDSAAIYALYSYDMNDSTYAQMATQEVERTHKLYNYSRHKEQSIREKERADKEHSRFIVISITSFFAGSFVLLLYRRKVKKQQEERNEYEETKRKYRKLLQEKEELNNLAKSIMAEEESNKAKLNDIIEEKTREIKQLEDKLNHFNIDTLNIKDTLEDVYKKSDIFEVLEPKIKRGIKLSDEDLAKIESFAQQNMQSLYSFLKSCNLSDNRKRYTCFLFRLHLGVKDVSNLLGVSSPYISKISSDMVTSLFSKTGSSKELKKELLKFDRIDVIPANI